MKFIIHRGTQEIGGSCIEVCTKNTRILIDFGMPLVDKNGNQFNFYPYRNFTQQELIKVGILHDIEGLYPDTDKLIDGIIISHAHQDHIGLLPLVHPDIHYYLGEATHDIIKLGNTFNHKNVNIQNHTYFKSSKLFNIGDITITPYCNDHSAFDAYSFLIEANGKSIFYSGDFRAHGRKAKAFEWFTHNAPKHLDYLLLEGSTIGDDSEVFKTEEKLEQDFVNLFKKSDDIHFVMTSSQNIDRLVTIYKACLQAKKTFVVDVYTANVLDTLSKYALLPTPLNHFKQIEVMYPHALTTRLYEEGNGHLADKFATHKVTKETISANPSNYVVIVRPGMKADVEKITVDKGVLVYSMWEGYMQNKSNFDFINYLKNRNFTLEQIHTSGHADMHTLKRMVEAIKPKHIVPMHTFEGDKYQEIFDYPVVRLQDREVLEIKSFSFIQ